MAGAVFKLWFGKWYFAQRNPASGHIDAGFYPQIVNYYFDFPRTQGRDLIERGFFGSLYITGGRTLELCCGDGFFTKNYYAPLSLEVLAVDLSDEAIRLARLNHGAENITYSVSDIRSGIAAGPWDNVIWDGAMEYFSEDEIRPILAEIARRLAPGGVLSGCVLWNCEDARADMGRERTRFYMRDESHMRAVLPFKHVRFAVRASNVRPTRTTCYFACCDAPLPDTFKDLTG